MSDESECTAPRPFEEGDAYPCPAHITTDTVSLRSRPFTLAALWVGLQNLCASAS